MTNPIRHLLVHVEKNYPCILQTKFLNLIGPAGGLQRQLCSGHLQSDFGNKHVNAFRFAEKVSDWRESPAAWLSFWSLGRSQNMASREYIEWLGAAELHWFFIQGEQALEQELYLPGTVGLINGIEASIRFTLHKLDGKTLDEDLGATLSNPLIRRARDRGLPVHTLAFPDEHDFDAKLGTRDSYVEVVRVRHNLAHGNIVEYINREHGFFTPECLRDTSSHLLTLSREWARQLGEFRKEHVAA